ncbi:MAG: adenosylhomocysteinase [Patescibacteria group bacterium]
MQTYDVKDLQLSVKGRLRIEWAGREMPVLKLIGERFKKTRPLKRLVIGACLHVTAETANLMLTLQAGGAKLFLCASNPLSTQDDVAASLVKDFNIPVFAIKGEDTKTYYRHLSAVLDQKPNLTMDDGADLVSDLHRHRPKQLSVMVGSSEETTTGVIRLKAMDAAGALKLPVIAVNDSLTKHLFDNRYGTGQSSLDGILRATNVLLAGKTFVTCGYGWCGRGVAAKARGMGANVIVTEVDPLKALEAVMDGFRVMPIFPAAKIGDIFITATGDKNVINEKDFNAMKNGVIVCNTGHFNVEFNIPALEKMAVKKRNIRQFVDEYTLKDGRKINILAEGRLVNLAAAEGHPAEVMDMSFANQALAAEYLVINKGKLQAGVYTLPADADAEIAALKLKAMGIQIDSLTSEQKAYLASWQEGT